MQRSVDDVVSTLKAAKASNRRCSLLIGAGCSVKAGIPLANEFVRTIEREHQSAYNRAKKKTYPHCMYELPPGTRRDLIARYVDQAKINWAHIAIAQLIKFDYIDRVLTPNFDPLVMRACALVGEFPAVYDFAASQMFNAAFIPDKAIFHLHGQRSGFRLLHTDEEVKKLSEALEPVFEDAGKGRMWLVVGYSGDNDPVFEHLARVKEFDYGLYWVTYRDQEPAAHVQAKLLTQDKQAYYVNGYDADEFFVELAQKLECFPPDLISRPFSHVDKLLQMLTPVELPVSNKTSEEFDFISKTRELVSSAIDRYEESKIQVEDNEKQSSLKTIIATQKALLEGNLPEAVLRISEMPPVVDAETKRVNAWAYIMAANQNVEMANRSIDFIEEADRLFGLAMENYQAALAIKPDSHEALNNWGTALMEQARTKQGDEADQLFRLAMEKYQAALAIKPDKHETLYNWGTALLEQAKTKQGEKADQLFALAMEKYQAALAIKPDSHETLYNWGNILLDQAKTKQGEKADQLLGLAMEKYQAALAIKPDKHEALNNWGAALMEQAKTKQGEKADQLFALAMEKYQAALAIKPDKHEALYNWGTALMEQARTKQGDEADQLFRLAMEKYQAALAIKPDSHDVLSNWGTALMEQARTKQGDKADQLFRLAMEKYQAALAIKPDKHEALYNWGNALMEQARTKQGDEADRLFELAMENYQAALAIKPDKHEALYNWGNALMEQARTKQGEKADQLFALTMEKYKAALAIKPDKHEALYNWGTALMEQTKTKQGDEADQLFGLATEKYQAALAIKPDSHETLYNWGNILLDHAKTKQGEKADQLFALAMEKYQAALAIKPDSHEVLHNWGASLLYQAKTKQGEEANLLFGLAEQKLQEAERIKPGSGAFNLACIASLSHNEILTRKWLNLAKAQGALPDLEHLDKDEDLDSVRNYPWFHDFLRA